MSEESRTPARMPPSRFIRTAWKIHRAIHRLTGRRVGLWRPRGRKWGTLRLTTVGRRTGEKREAIVGYYEDGRNLVTLAMNGWMDGEPGWWLNLQAHPDVTVELADGSRAVHARPAEGDERARLLARWSDMAGGRNLEALAARRSMETAVVVLEPVDGR